MQAAIFQAKNVKEQRMQRCRLVATAARIDDRCYKSKTERRKKSSIAAVQITT